MSVTIQKIRLINFKRFQDYTVEPNSGINVLVGDNEVGKSSILEAIDLVASGNIRKVESIGVDRLLNINAVNFFNLGPRQYDRLPKMIIELYLDGHGTFGFEMNGKNNTDGVICDGIRLVCDPNPDYQDEIIDSLAGAPEYFPYDYYRIRFSTFADEGYSGYKKKVRTILIDSSNMDSEYATTDFVRRMYHRYTDSDIKDRAVHRSEYRKLKESFRTGSLMGLNGRIPPDKKYTFGLRMAGASEFENDLMIFEDGVGIDSKGTGRQVFIKTDFTLERAGSQIDVVLLEEPENHLSHTKLRELVQRVASAPAQQMFVTTHNSLISTRLELQNVLLMGTGHSGAPTSLRNITTDTNKYFLKAPVANLLEFAISNRVILVEGPSEYMLFEKFYETVIGSKPEHDGIHVIDVHGLSFKRYLEVGKLLGTRVAILTDNDGDPQKHCIEKYDAYSTDSNIRIFFEPDDTKWTFEIVFYHDNQSICDNLFGGSAQEYMLHNKTEAAYQLLVQDQPLTVPTYIQEAIKWIKE